MNFVVNLYVSPSLKTEFFTDQKFENQTIRMVFFITVRAVMTLLTYRIEENPTNRLVFKFLVRNSFDPFQTSHGKRTRLAKTQN